MRNLFPRTLVFSALYFVLPSCQKNSSGPSTSTQQQLDSLGTTTADSVAGSWSVFEDEIVNYNNYFFSDATGFNIPLSGTYYGVTNDNFNFKTDGTYSGHENGISGAGTYQLLANRAISITPRPALIKAVIQTLTVNTLTIYGTDTSGNGGVLIETLSLKR